MPDVVGRLKTPRLSGAPSSPTVGELYYNTATNILYWWNGTTWVSASGGAAGGVAYTGGYTTPKTYHDGDIVVDTNGVSWICVKEGTTTPPDPWPVGTSPTIPPLMDGQWLKASSGSLIWSPITQADVTGLVSALAGKSAVPGYGTSLPGSPVDGQEYILVDSTTNPTYQWRFRYNASNTTTYKWEFIGGPSAEVEDSTTYTIPSGWTVIGTPQLTIPRNGVYDVMAYLDYVGGATADVNVWSAPGITAQLFGSAAVIRTTFNQGNPPVTARTTVTTAPVALRFYIYAAAAVSATAYRRVLVCKPVRVS